MTRKARFMKSKEKLWVLTKEGLTHEVKKDHEGPKAQKEGKIKKKVKKKKKRPRLRPQVGSPTSKKWILRGKA